MGVRLFLQKGRLPRGIVLPANIPPKLIPKKAAQQGVFYVNMLDAPDVPDGGQEAVIGFGIEDSNGDPVQNTFAVELRAFADSQLTEIPVSGVMFSEASAGFIIDGDKSPWIKAQTDNDGEFACKLTCIPRATIYIAAFQPPGGPLLNCSEVDAVTFKATGVE